VVTTRTSLPERFIDCCGSTVQLFVEGSGPPLLVLHDIDGGFGLVDLISDLAADYTVYLPSHPGFNRSSRPEWLETVPDLAAWYVWFLGEMDITPTAAIGFSLGGWLGAEIAARSRGSLERLVLVAPTGLKPVEGEIGDLLLMSPAEAHQIACSPADGNEAYSIFTDTDPVAKWLTDRNLSMTARLGWRPFMHDPALAGILNGIAIPVQIVCGANDEVLPPNYAEQYHALIPGSRLSIINECGHFPHVAKPKELLQSVREFLS
jgi:pimeloyl-ACP methyl ester carboxylesterase